MISQLSLGRKIRKYRMRAGYSQFDLELELETSPGRISRIENGKVNPDKETIINIAKVLNLDSFEIASLFGIAPSNVVELFDEVNNILLSKKLEKILDKTVNDLIFKLGFLASAVFIVKEERIHMVDLTSSGMARKALTLLPAPLSSLYIPLGCEDNLTVKTIMENKPNLTNNTWEYITPMVDKITADRIQKVTGDKSTYIVPLAVNGHAFGAIAFVKKIESNFDAEKDTLQLFSKQIAIALYGLL